MERIMQADLIVKNAAELLTCQAAEAKRGDELQDLGLIADGALAIKDGRIEFVGRTADLSDWQATETIDARGKVVMPGFVDCHTHLVFGGSREKDLLRKLRGDSYLEILKQGGGILSTVEHTRAASADELFAAGMNHLDTMLALGTTTVEIKSGYGLNPETERKILEVAARLEQAHPIDIVTTYLGAHTIPKEKTKSEYIAEVLDSLEEMKPLAEFCDIFCEEGVFTYQETRRILTAAKECGYKLKIHAEQLNTLHGAELAAELGAVSADHLDHISPEGIARMAASSTIGVLLPAVPFYLMLSKYAPAREMIEQGMALALATDFNPGSCPCESMSLMLTFACLQMKLLPSEAINCATINAAYAIDRGATIGSIEQGKQADILIVAAPNHETLSYRFGRNLVERVIKKGVVVQVNS
jgi:imidazolonepropionase